MAAWKGPKYHGVESRIPLRKADSAWISGVSPLLTWAISPSAWASKVASLSSGEGFGLNDV